MAIAKHTNDLILFPTLVIPEVEVIASPPVVLIGGSTTLTCNVTRANPTDYTTFTWTHNNSSTDFPETSNTLTLSPVRESDLGVYHCRVTNSAGTGSGIFNLAVGKCKIHLHSQLRTWLKLGHMHMKKFSTYVYTATCTGDCTVQPPAGVPLTTIIAAVCSVAVAVLLLLVAVIAILMIRKFKKYR